MITENLMIVDIVASINTIAGVRAVLSEDHRSVSVIFRDKEKDIPTDVFTDEFYSIFNMIEDIPIIEPVVEPLRNKKGPITRRGKGKDKKY